VPSHTKKWGHFKEVTNQSGLVFLGRHVQLYISSSQLPVCRYHHAKQSLVVVCVVFVYLINCIVSFCFIRGIVPNVLQLQYICSWILQQKLCMLFIRRVFFISSF